MVGAKQYANPSANGCEPIRQDAGQVNEFAESKKDGWDANPSVRMPDR